MDFLNLAFKIKEIAKKPIGEFALTEEMFKNAENVVANALVPIIEGKDEFYVDEGDGGFDDQWITSFDKITPFISCGSCRFLDGESGCNVSVKVIGEIVLIKWTNEVGGLSLSMIDLE